MKKIYTAATGLVIAILFTWASPAMAEEASGPTFETCSNLGSWFVNEDEHDRVPTPTVEGLKFEGDDLIHHAAVGTVEDLTPGTFAASPAPDQNSFFSVEVFSGPGTYATLRWNTDTSKWNMVTGGSFYENADPAELVDMVTPHKSHTLVRFGVGYTQNPPGTVATVVSDVTFGGTKYDLTCKTPTEEPTSESPSATPTSTSPSTTTSASPTRSSSAPVAGVGGDNSNIGAGLPVTGPSVGLIIAVGGLILAGGAALIVASRRRRNQFEA